MQLNPKQKEAAESLDGPTLVVAGAGAGKTRVLVERIVNLIKSGKAEAREILAITFTNKAAKEMRERVLARIDSDKDLNRPVNALYSGLGVPFVSTFHSLGVHIMREQAKLLQIKKHFAILDRQDQKRITKEAMKKLGLDSKEKDPNFYINSISRAKSDALSPEIYLEMANSYSKEEVYHVWSFYEKIKKKEGSFDFDDLLLVPLKLLQENDEVLSYYQNVWKYILVDEYQDTNKVQFEILRLLAGKEQNLFAVGDIDQSIYAWRGAKPDLMLLFEKHFKDAKLIFLEQNYRSTKNIIEAANAVIEKNQRRQKKVLFSENKEGEKIKLIQAFSAQDEARKIARKARELIEKGYDASEIAVLYRMNFISRVLEDAFLSEGVPYQILGTRFFDRKEIKDLISFLRLALNRDSLSDLYRATSAVPRGIGKVALLKIQEGKTAELPASSQVKVKNFFAMLDEIYNFALKNRVSETLRFILDKSGLAEHLKSKGQDGQERLANLFELIELSKKYDVLPSEEALEKFLDEAALSQDQDELEKDGKGVRLMTVHASKGLEFKAVFVSALEQGIFPAERFDEKDDEEEERRLFYVAITRAKEELYLSHAMERQVFGETSISEPSEFLQDLPEALIEIEESFQTENQEEDKNKNLGHDRGIDLIEW